MIKKHVAREINELQTVNAKLRQAIDANNRDLINQIEKYKTLENNSKRKFNELKKEIKQLKAELTYWKETADHWTNVAFEFERHNKYLKELNKTLDKQKH